MSTRLPQFFGKKIIFKLYRPVLQCIVLYCIMLHCNGLSCILLHYIVYYCILFWHSDKEVGSAEVCQSSDSNCQLQFHSGGSWRLQPHQYFYQLPLSDTETHPAQRNEQCASTTAHLYKDDTLAVVQYHCRYDLEGTTIEEVYDPCFLMGYGFFQLAPNEKIHQRFSCKKSAEENSQANHDY